MVDTQLFCLRWKNYQSRITSAFEDLRDEEDFVDVTLACGSKTLKAHRVVLSAGSPYFRELLKSTSCKHPVIVLQDVAFNDLRALVEFIYHGEVNINPASLGSFLKTAGVLGVSGLSQQVDQTDKPSRAAASVTSAGNLLTRDKKHNEGWPRRGSTPIGQRFPKCGQIRKNETLSSDSRDNRTSKKQRGCLPPLNASGAIPTKSSTIKNHSPSKDKVINKLNIKCKPLESTPNYLSDSQSITSTSGSLKSSRPSPIIDLAALGSEYDSRTPDLPENLRIRKVATTNRDCRSVITLDEVSHADYQEVTRNADDGDDDADDDDEDVMVEEEDEGEVEDDEGGGDEDEDEDDDDDLGNERTRDPLALMMNSDGNDELLIIDNLDEVHNNMTMKTEPTSPKSNPANDFESCPSEFNDPNFWQNDSLDRDSCGKRKQSHSLDKELDISSAPPTRRSNRKLLEMARKPIAEKQPSEMPLYCNTTSKVHCHLCKKTFSRAWSLQRHLDDIHYYVPQPFPCDLCGRNYKSRNSLISHKSQFHPMKEKKYYDHLYNLTY